MSKQKVWKVINPETLVGYTVTRVINKDYSVSFSTDKKSLIGLVFSGEGHNNVWTTQERTILVGRAGELWEEVEV